MLFVNLSSLICKPVLISFTSFNSMRIVSFKDFYIFVYCTVLTQEHCGIMGQHRYNSNF